MTRDDWDRLEKMNVLFKLFDVKATAFYAKPQSRSQTRLKKPYRIRHVAFVRLDDEPKVRTRPGKDGHVSVVPYRAGGIYSFNSVEGLERKGHALIAAKQAE